MSHMIPARPDWRHCGNTGMPTNILVLGTPREDTTEDLSGE